MLIKEETAYTFQFNFYILINDFFIILILLLFALVVLLTLCQFICCLPGTTLGMLLLAKFISFWFE